MRKEKPMDDKATSPDPDDLTGNTPPTRPMTPSELHEFEGDVVQREGEPDEDVPDSPPVPSHD